MRRASSVFGPNLLRVASSAQVVVCVHLAETDGTEEDVLVVVFEDLSHRNEVEQGFPTDAGGLLDRERSGFERNRDPSIEGLLSLVPILAVRRHGVESQHVAVEFFEFFRCRRFCAEAFLEPKGCAENEIGEDDGVSFPSTDLHFVLEVGFSERVVGELSHTRVAVGIGAFLRDVGGVVVEESSQLFARRDRALSCERREPLCQPSRQVLQGGEGGKVEHTRQRDE